MIYGISVGQISNKGLWDLKCFSVNAERLNWRISSFKELTLKQNQEDFPHSIFLFYFLVNFNNSMGASGDSISVSSIIFIDKHKHNA